MKDMDLKYFLIIVFPRIALSFFLFCIFLSMYLYPGSTYINHDTTKYLFNENFLSDLGRTITHGGQNNFHSSFLFNFALVLGGITYIIFFSFTHKIFDSNRLSKIGSLLGLGGALSMIGVALTPSDLMYDPHIFFNMWIFRFFLLSTLCYSWLMYKHNGIENYYLIGNLIFVIFLLTYVLILIYGPSPRESAFALIFQVTAQKIILFNFILSILVQTVAYSKIIHSK